MQVEDIRNVPTLSGILPDPRNQMSQILQDITCLSYLAPFSLGYPGTPFLGSAQSTKRPDYLLERNSQIQ
jgi:hypothetical protein